MGRTWSHEHLYLPPFWIADHTNNSWSGASQLAQQFAITFEPVGHDQCRCRIGFLLGSG